MPTEWLGFKLSTTPHPVQQRHQVRQHQEMKEAEKVMTVEEEEQDRETLVLPVVEELGGVQEQAHLHPSALPLPLEAEMAREATTEVAHMQLSAPRLPQPQQQTLLRQLPTQQLPLSRPQRSLQRHHSLRPPLSLHPKHHHQSLRHSNPPPLPLQQLQQTRSPHPLQLVQPSPWGLNHRPRASTTTVHQAGRSRSLPQMALQSHWTNSLQSLSMVPTTSRSTRTTSSSSAILPSPLTPLSTPLTCYTSLSTAR